MAMLDFIIFLSIIALLIIVGVFRSKHIKTESSYLFAERKLKWLSLTATLVMTEFNSATLLSFASLGYGVGIKALLLPLIFLFGLLFYAGVAARKWKEYDGVSVAGFFRVRYSPGIAVFTSALLLLAMLIFNATYIKSLTILFQPLVPTMNPWIVSAGLLSFVLLLSLRGGLLAIVRTDLLSFFLILLFFPFLALFLCSSSSLPPPAYPTTFFQQDALSLRFVISLTILTMFTYILAPWYGQKIFAAHNAKVATHSVIAAAFLIFLLYGSAIVATAFLRYRGFECTSWEMALPQLIDRCLPMGMKGLGYALFFATSATTLTGALSAMSAMCIGDFLKKETSSIDRSILLTLGFAMISYLLANTFIDKIFDKIILANIPIAALSFGLLAGFYWKRASPTGVLVSIFTGILCGAGSYWIFAEEGCYTWYWAIIGIPLTFAAGVVASLLYPQKQPAGAEYYS